MEFLKAGGFFMIPLLFCSLVALTIIIERFSALRHQRILGNVLPAALEAKQHTSTDIEAFIRKENTVLSRLLTHLYAESHREREAVLEHLRAAARREINRMERGLVVLEIVAVVSPLLGLLGTVSGFVTIFGNIDPQQLGEKGSQISRGISEALTTTITGLVIAIPSLVCWNILSRKIDTYSVELEHLLQVALRKFPHSHRKR